MGSADWVTHHSAAFCRVRNQHPKMTSGAKSSRSGSRGGIVVACNPALAVSAQKGVLTK